MGKSDYLENEILKYCTGQANAIGTAPTPWLALFTATPSDTGGGTEVSTSSTGYARVNISGKFGTPSAGILVSTGLISFGTPTTTWGTIVAAAIFDASTAGNLLRWDELTASKSIGVGDSAVFAIGAITLREG